MLARSTSRLDQHRFPRLPHWIAVALALVFGALRSQYRPPLGDGLDGAYYFQMARQVAAHAGLATSYSVFHMGLSPLPQPATSYPLLPLSIGYLGRLIGLERAALWLPGAAYVMSVVLCFLFLTWATDRSLPRSPRSLRLSLCALLSIWVGLNPVYVWSSARPYTEPLANTLTFAALWAFGVGVTARLRSRAWRRAAFFTVGVLSGLCYLARFQLVVVPVALISTRLVVRKRGGLGDASWLLGGALCCIAWPAVRLFSLPNPDLYSLLDFAKYRQLPELPAFIYDLQFEHRLDWWVDKLEGLKVSFDPTNDESYFMQMGPLSWLAPLGLAWAIVTGARGVHRRGSRAWTSARVRRPRHAALVASALLGLLAVLPLHTVHSLHWRTWSFAWRQGMPLLYLILPIAIALWSRPRPIGKAIVLVLLALSVARGAQKTTEVVARRVPTQMLRAYADVAAYLNSVGPTKGTLGIEHQSLSVFSPEPLYWLACWSPPALASVLVQRLPVDRILLRPGEMRCPSLDEIRPRLRVEKPFLAHYPMTLYRIQR